MLFDSFEAYDVQAVRKESKIQTYIENILSLLEDLGPVPDELQLLLEKETDLNTLKIWIKLAAKSDSLEEFQSNIHK